MGIKNKLRKLASVLAAVSLTLTVFVSSTAYAGTYTARSLNTSNANPSATGVTFTFTFTVVNTATTYNHVLITYSTSADMSGGIPTSLNPGTSGSTTLAGTTPSFTFTTPSTKLSWAAGSAQTSGSKTITLTNVTNPSTTGVFYAKIAAYSSADESALIDSGTVASATVPVVTVSGQQLESLTASVAAKTTGTVCDAVTVLGTTTATAINFGNFNGTTPIAAAQTLTLGSNATSGITAKVVENQVLTGPSTLADFGGATDGSAGTAWSSGTSTGFGMCAKGGDSNHSGTNSYVNFGSASNGTLWMGLTTAKSVANTTGPSASTSTDIEYTVAVPANLPAGTYTNQLTYNIFPNY